MAPICGGWRAARAGRSSLGRTGAPDYRQACALSLRRAHSERPRRLLYADRSNDVAIDMPEDAERESPLVFMARNARFTDSHRRVRDFEIRGAVTSL